MITEDSQFTTQKNKQAYKPLIFIEFDDASEYWASREMDPGSETISLGPNWSDGSGAIYKDILQSMGGIETKVSLYGGFASIGGVEIDLVNLGSYSDFLQGNKYENDVVEIYIVFNDGTGFVWSETLQVFTGIIDQFHISYDRLTVSIAHYDLLANKKVGDLIETDSYDIDGREILSDAIGEVFPIVMGDHTYNIHSTDPTDFGDFDNINPLVKPVMYDKEIDGSDQANYHFIVSDHTLYEFTNDDVWLFDKKQKRFMHVESSVSVTNTDANGNAIFTLLTDTDGKVEVSFNVYGDGSYDNNVGNWANQGEASDREKDGNCNIDESWSGGSGGTASSFDAVFYKLEDLDVDGTDVSDIDIYARVSETAFTGDVLFEIDGTDASGGSGTFVKLKSYTGASATLTEIGKDITVEAKLDPAYPSGNGRVAERVYEIYKRVTLDLLFDPDRFDVMVACKGMEYSSWITSRTSHPDHSAVAGGFIENPVGLIEEIARDRLSLSSSDIDTGAFDAAASARSSWKFSYQLREQTDGISLLRDMARACQCYLFWNNENKLSIVAFTELSSLNFTDSGTTTPNAADIYNDNPTVTSNSFDQNVVKSDSLELRKTPLEEFTNDLTTRYGVSNYTGNFQKSSNTTDATSQSEYGATVEMEVDNPFVYDDTTIGYFENNEIEMRKDRLFEVYFASFLNAVSVELGDVINVRTGLIEGLLGSSHGSYFWQIVGITPNLLRGVGEVDIVAICRGIYSESVDYLVDDSSNNLTDDSGNKLVA